MSALTSLLAKTFFNHKFKRYGHMTRLQIDPLTKTISLTANLAGESEPVDATLKYALEEEAGRLYFVPSNPVFSREWMTLLGKEILEKQKVRVEIPSGIASMALKALKL